MNGLPGAREKSSDNVMQGPGRKTVASYLFALMLWAWIPHAQSVALEYQVKASYLYNFMQFIAWPMDVFDADGKFNLCVVGAERFGSALDVFPGERLEGREIVIRRLKSATPTQTAHCHLLFIAAGEDDAAFRGVIGERGVLTIGETPGFLERGGIINLVEMQGRIRFQINRQAAHNAGLMMSSRLLDLALKQQ